MSLLLSRGLLTLAFIIMGIGIYFVVNRMILKRAGRKNFGLETFRMGQPGILYFTMEDCIPCKTTQRPALEALVSRTGDQVQIIEVDVVAQPELAENWGVLSVPTTFIIDPQGRPRRVNHGVALAEKLLSQLESDAGYALVRERAESQVEMKASESGTG